MKYKDLLDRFYEFEVTHKLFDRVDRNGINYWDIFRYAVFSSLTLGSAEIELRNRTHKINDVVSSFFSFLKCIASLVKRKKYLCYLVSRNRMSDNGLFFDQNSYGLVKNLSKEDCILYETFNKYNPTVYSDYTIVTKSVILDLLFRDNRDFSLSKELISEIRETFPESAIQEEDLNFLYSKFLSERRLFRFLLGMWRPKKIFMTQNGILKGIFSVAKELGIPIYEFQHGTINDGHLVYSYPKLHDINDKVYLPTYLLTFSDFWLKDSFIPYTKIMTIGNDYFKPAINIALIPKKRQVLVVSSSFMANELKNFLANCYGCFKDFSSYSFVYKLHPNEFDKKTEYVDFFRDYSNILISTNEKNISQWMSECETMLTIYSTAAFEALQCGRKVVILKELSYEQMNLIKDCKNVFFVKTPVEFENVLQTPHEKDKVEFFSSLRSEAVYRCIYE